MLNWIVFLVFFGAWAGTWVWLARVGRRRGWGDFKRHGLGALSGLMTAWVLGAIALVAVQTPEEKAAWEARQAKEADEDRKREARKQVDRALEAEKQLPVRWQAVARQVFGDRLHKAEWNDGRLGQTYMEGSHAVWFKANTGFNPGDVVGSAGLSIHAFLKKAHEEGILRNPMSVQFLVMVDLRDGYGNLSTEKVLNLNFLGDDLKKINWKNVNQFMLLDLAESVTSSNRVGGEILGSYCSDKDSWQLTPRFCAKAIRK